MKINGRRRKNFIHKLGNGTGWVSKHEDKENIMYQHFTTALSKGPRRTTDFNWQLLHFTDCDLSSLGDEMTDEEVIAAIKAMPSDKAPGPDGFTGAFFKSCWPIIKDDLMKVISAFSSLRRTFTGSTPQMWFSCQRRRGLRRSQTLGLSV